MTEEYDFKEDTLRTSERYFRAFLIDFFKRKPVFNFEPGPATYNLFAAMNSLAGQGLLFHNAPHNESHFGNRACRTRKFEKEYVCEG